MRHVSNMDELKTLYNERILQLAAEIGATQRLDAPQATARITSPICGSRLQGDYVFEDGRLAQYGQRVHACALGQASASLFARLAIGQTVEHIQAAGKAMEQLLVTGAADAIPAGWEELTVMAPVKDYSARHAAVMLPYRAFEKALKERATPTELTAS